MKLCIKCNMPTKNSNNLHIKGQWYSICFKCHKNTMKGLIKRTLQKFIKTQGE